MIDDIFINEVEDETEEDSQPVGAPPGTVFVGTEGVAHPGDGTAWIGDMVIDPNAW